MSSQSIAPGDQSDSASTHSSERIATDKIIIPKAALKDAELVTAQGNVITKDGVIISTQDSNQSLPTNIFQDPEVKSYYIDLYEKSKYECRHVFDADLTWTPEEEKRLVRKLDVRGECTRYSKSPLIAMANCFMTKFAFGLVPCSSVSKLIVAIWFKQSRARCYKISSSAPMVYNYSSVCSLCTS